MAHFADFATQTTALLVDNDLVAKDTMRVRLSVAESFARVVPGQFFMVRLPDCNDPLIGRAFALFDCRHGLQATGWLDLVYLVKGKLTSRLAKLRPGQSVELWGPLGNGFSTAPTQHLIMVAGGIGQTPFLTLGREALGQQTFGTRCSGYADRVSLCYGVRSEAYLACVDSFRSTGVAVHVATEDGSLGPPRRVTELLEEVLGQDRDSSGTRVVCCGPEPMMAAVSRICAHREISCEVSLETPMACGIGICFTCVAKVGSSDDWDYKRTCVEGPIFDAQAIVWD